ncbi:MULTISPECIES: hypothetical protein [unclassified Luteococcus]|uniref:hypothetical protein n=1 Tax=unclassified Luteococcus TaxID=2639923 RepID=UPI00313DFD38
MSSGTASRRPKRLNLATWIILLAVLVLAFTLRHHLALTLANATGRATVHPAQISAVTPAPWFTDFCDADKRQKSYDVHVRWTEPDAGQGSYRLCLKEHERRALHVGQTQQVLSEPWLGAVGRDQSRAESFLFAMFGPIILLVTGGLAIWLFRPEFDVRGR